MEAFLCQATNANVAEIVAEEQVKADSISTLTSTEMSFVGGGTMVAVFA